ncbi:cytochrome C oxidase subunit IV family protein [Sneathiella chinensis]|uniref:Cytochrome c oxidase subunit IV n=1 Tax=Sneathiella chinensis TaxID=349750 RepID=A0ABQ5U483_9PROT|nr:cytochrome C oxidase subunit IV family protein [Sneathiella chinensis]GLQ06084.1 cytochrome c oxidase subunit IV [Sneathiella chinensis]
MTSHAQAQLHPIRIYLMIWALLFVLSLFSYLVDYFHVEGALRWSLIILLMLGKASLIVAVFMHMAWERLALVLVILLPPALLLMFVGMMVLQSDYTLAIRSAFFGTGL